MSRVKRGTISMKRRRNVLKAAKGFRFGRSTKEREAKVALRKAGTHAFAHRKDKKADFRRLWTVNINSGVRAHGMSYSVFIKNLKDKNVLLNRKMLAILAEDHPTVFEEVVKTVA
jgi:large subunit ribosomal protein L20